MTSAPAELLQALEDDMLAHHRGFAKLPDSVNYNQPDCFFYKSEINFGAFGGILAQRFTTANVRQRVEELNNAIRQTGKDIGWVLSPVATPANLEQVIAELGARKIVELKGMSMDMRDLAEPKDVAELEIRLVDDEASVVEYARIYPLLYHVPIDDWIDKLIDAELYIFRNKISAWNR